MLKHGATVFMLAHSQYRGLLVGIAKRLRSELDARIHLYCATAQEVVHYQNIEPVDGLFASISAANDLYRICAEPVSDAEAVAEKARANEAWLGTTINTIVLSDRHLGRGYALGGFRHPRSRISEGTSYPQMLNGINAAISFWRDEFRRHKPDVMINGNKTVALVAHAENVPLRGLAGARYRNYHYWAVDEYYSNPAVEAAFARADADGTADLSAPYDGHMQMRRHFASSDTLLGTLKAMTLTMARLAYWRLRGYEKGRGYYGLEQAAFLMRRYTERKVLEKSDAVSLADLKGKPFVYYPLHTEPETALQTLSPEYFYQLSAIAALSRDLPAGAVLAVKETLAALGRRPANFHDQIREFKNVVMLDPVEYGLSVAREASAVATITGTGGFEAAVMGKPVITFGRHNVYNFLPHVMVVEDETSLAGYLAHALGSTFDAAQARLDGARFLQAVIDTSFDLGDFSVTAPEHANPEMIEAASREFIPGSPQANAAARSSVAPSASGDGSILQDAARA